MDRPANDGNDRQARQNVRWVNSTASDSEPARRRRNAYSGAWKRSTMPQQPRCSQFAQLSGRAWAGSFMLEHPVSRPNPAGWTKKSLWMGERRAPRRDLPIAQLPLDHVGAINFTIGK